MADIIIQGNLDKGCGFYSVLNAISEVNGMKYDRILGLFGEFSKRYPDIASKGYIRGLVFKEIRNEIVPRLTELLTKDEKVDYSFPFSDMRFETVGHFANRLRAAIDGPACAVLGFGHPWNHWTAATSVSDSAIVLKDSTYKKWKMLDSIDLKSNDSLYKSGTLLHSRQTIVFNRK